MAHGQLRILGRVVGPGLAVGAAASGQEPFRIQHPELDLVLHVQEYGTLPAVGMYTSVRGWIEVDHKQRAAVEKIITDAEDGFYSGGWAFPRSPFNWSLYVFYGGDIREGQLPWLRDQVEKIAALDPVDEDLDMPIGLLIVTDERGSVIAWELDDGLVRERQASELSWTFKP